MHGECRGPSQAQPGGEHPGGPLGAAGAGPQGACAEHLSPDDGQAVPLYRQRPTKEGGQESSLVVPLPPQGQNLSLWFDCSELTGGYLRLAVNSTVSSQIDQEYSRRALEHYALIDPELSLLFRQP